MGEFNEPKAKQIPAWQLPKAMKDPKAPESQRRRTAERSTPQSRASLIEKASKFLDDEEIREASDEQKTHFLQTKGLTDEEIGLLLSKRDPVAEAEPTQNEGSEQRTETIVNDATTPSQSDKVDKMDDYMDSELPATPEDDRRPPIITYPEFLLESRKSPPLMTEDRLLTALYVASGAAATMYGLNNHVGRTHGEVSLISSPCIFGKHVHQHRQIEWQVGGGGFLEFHSTKMTKRR